MFEEGIDYSTHLVNRSRYRLFEGGLDSAIDNAVTRFYENLPPDDLIFTTSNPRLRRYNKNPETMKERVKIYVEEDRMSIADAVEFEYARRRNNVWQWEIRSPEVPDGREKTWRFKARYAIDHPDDSYLDIHRACMKVHPELWPRSIPQSQSPSQNYGSVYHH